MSQPSRSEVHVNKPLTNISIAYIQEANGFIADKVFPVVPVQKQADRYFVYDKAAFLSTNAQLRAPGTESAGSGFKIDSTPSYFCDVYAVHQDVDDQTRANVDEPLDIDRDATEFVTQQMLLKREATFVNTFLKTGIWSADVTPGVKWDGATSDPMLDVDLQKQAIKGKTGFMPNTLVVGTDVFMALRNNKAVMDRIKYTQRGVVTEELLAGLFGVDKFLVASAVLNTGSTTDFMVKTSALLCYSNPTPSILKPSAGYTFAWSGLFGAGAQGNRISSFRMEHLKSDRIEGEMAFAMKQIGSDLGTFLNAVL